MPSPAQVDPRGLRFGAGLTAVVLALVLVVPSEGVRITLLAVQVGVFAIAVLAGLQHSPYAIVFARVVRPRIGAPVELEDSRPPRFAQLVGLAFTATALGLLLAGASTAALVAAAFALVAALLNAVVGLCLGCELYLVLRRIVPAGT